MKFKHWEKVIRNNYFIILFIAAVGFVGFVSAYKLFFAKSTYVYARVKIGQGLWWASTNKPSIWFVNALKKGMVQKDLVGKPLAEILEVRYYPAPIPNQFDIYLTLKLKVAGVGKSGTYNFNRSAIGVSSPIDLEFPAAQFSGTVTDLSTQPFNDRYVEKTLTLIKPGAFPWEYEAIKVGDSYFDGENRVFEVIDKNNNGVTQLIPLGGKTIDLSQSQARQDISVRVKVLVKQIDNTYIFGNEQVVNAGKSFNLSTPNYTYSDFVISQIDR